MSVTISAANGAGSTSPLTILSPWETTWSARNVIHDLIGGGIAVSLVAPRPRSGELTLLYDTETDAFAAAALHREETTFTLTETETPSVSMSYVVDGTGIRVALDEQTLLVWTVTVGYQEVIP
jgi:hypothetical protein